MKFKNVLYVNQKWFVALSIKLRGQHQCHNYSRQNENYVYSYGFLCRRTSERLLKNSQNRLFHVEITFFGYKKGDKSSLTILFLSSWAQTLCEEPTRKVCKGASRWIYWSKCFNRREALNTKHRYLIEFKVILLSNSRPAGL